jgi:hypothetical protein
MVVLSAEEVMPQFLVFLLVALSVIQTPSNYATQQAEAVTQFSLARDNGTLALIAHNYLGGRYFGGLAEGDQITLVYADHNQDYKVRDILRYDALSPFAFRVEVGESRIFSDWDVFDFIYHSHDDRLVLQTCYNGTGGRLFIIAYPKDE